MHHKYTLWLPAAPTMTTAAALSPTPCIDLRTIAPGDRHPLIFSTFQALAVGEALELVSDHEPRPLLAQFEARAPGQYSWDPVERGPSVWRVRIARRAEALGRNSCCGACGCA
jgi:uncharacterized protein (DUF2249 family)